MTKRIIGWVVLMMAALMEGESRNPRKKKVMLKVTPERPKRRTFGISALSTLRKSLAMKGKRSSAAKPKRQKAKVKGGILVSDHLKIGEAPPQMILAMIRAIMALNRADCICITHPGGVLARHLQ